MRNNIAIAVFAILVAGIVSCSQPEPTAIPAPVAVPAPQSVPPTPTPTQQPQTVTPAVVQEPPQDTPIPPTMPPPTTVPATVPPPGPSSQESALTGPKLTGNVVLSGAQELFSRSGLVLQPVVEEVSAFSLDGSQMAVGDREIPFPSIYRRMLHIC